MCPLPKNLGYATGICEHKFVISILVYLLYPLVVKLVSSVPVNAVPGVPRRRSVDSVRQYCSGPCMGPRVESCLLS